MRPDQYGIGTVWHRRTREHTHAFRYKLWFCLLDLDTLPERLEKSPWWSELRWNLVSFRRQDFIAPFERSIADAVRDRVEQHLGWKPAGQIRLLTQPRQWGLCFNPVSFYFCYSERQQLDSIVAEVHNTPWGERHAYVLDATGPHQSGPEYRFEFDKSFHVSPFLPMQMQYRWRFRLEADALAVHMLVMENGAESLRTGMQLSLQPLNRNAMLRMPLIFPLQTIKVFGGIYWQAFRLWMKNTRFYPHPRHSVKP